MTLVGLNNVLKRVVPLIGQPFSSTAPISPFSQAALRLVRWSECSAFPSDPFH